jgi:hypothetical protein
MNDNEFELEILARGGFINDLRANGLYPNALYRGEVITFRLTMFPSKYQFFSVTHRDAFPDGEEGDRQYKQRVAEKEALHTEFVEKVFEHLGLVKVEGRPSGCVTRVEAEVYTAFQILEIKI